MHTKTPVVHYQPACRVLGCLLAVAAFCGGATAWSATFYVAKTGSDTNSGTLSAPLRTLAAGSRKLTPGDTLLIRQGLYEEPMIHGQAGFVFRSGKSMDAMTHYAPYPGEQVIIKPPANAFVLYFPPTALYIEVSGLVIDGTNATSYAVKFGSTDTIYAQKIRLLRNEIRYGRMGISNGGGCEIIGNDIHHMKQYGIYTLGDHGLIEGNIFHDNGRYAIHHFQQNKSVNNWIIRNNLLFRNGKGYYSVTRNIWYRSAAVVLSRGSGTAFYNNILYDNYAGVQIGLGAVNTLMANNIVFGGDTYGIDVNSAYSGSRNARVVNNLVWANKGSQIFNNAINTTIEANLTTDPSVVNASAGDFRLRTGSPAINAGVNLSSLGIKKDFAGVSRPQTGPFEIGAYEYGSAPPLQRKPSAPRGLSVR